ncbi:MAG: non-hydrolyzing UDP-N-acetylglucosamine 2-epimerase [Hyphomicrobium sp.]
MIVSILGARPQFVKAAAVSRALVERGLEEKIVHTGQHFDDNMSDVFFRELGIPAPALNLGIGGGTHGQNTGRMLEAIEGVLVAFKADLVLVYGDTDSTLAGALAASKLHIPVAHVEAGLRSFNRRMPEEVNRVVTDHVSDLLFAPTETAMVNLAREGIKGCHLVGDVMFDVALHYATQVEARPAPIEGLPAGFALATVHRASNTDDSALLATILEAFRRSPLPIVLPLHPRTRKMIASFGLAIPTRVIVCPPVGFLDMVWLERRARVILTDSGGVQKEAYFQGVPCVTLRDETEWTELVDAGWNRLCPPASAEAIVAAIEAALASKPTPATLYGDGNAAGKIAAILAASSATAP